MIVPDEEYTYTGEKGRENMKRDLNSIIDACGEYTDFLELLGDVNLDRDEAQFQLYMEAKLRDI